MTYIDLLYCTIFINNIYIAMVCYLYNNDYDYDYEMLRDDICLVSCISHRVIHSHAHLHIVIIIVIIFFIFVSICNLII